MSAKDSFRCACGDTGYQIVKKSETWQSQGFWCSTTMSMLHYDGTTRYVWNPYSLEELEQTLTADKLDAYMQCVAEGKSCSPPSMTIFDQQQVCLFELYSCFSCLFECMVAKLRQTG